VSDRYRKVRRVKRLAAGPYYDRVAGQVARKSETVVDADGHRVQRRLGKMLAATALTEALQGVNNK